MMDETATSAVGTYDFYESPIGPKRVIKRGGYCWTAFFIGPAWLLWRQLWAQAIVFLVITGIFGYLIAAPAVPVAAVLWCGDMSYKTLSCEDTARGWQQVAIVLVVNSVIGALATELWAKDLLRRGYELVRSIEACSVDHALVLEISLKDDFQATKPGELGGSTRKH